METIIKEFEKQGLIIVNDLICDGNIHRVQVLGDKKNKKSGAYIVHNNNKFYSCFVQNFKTGYKNTFNTNVENNNYDSTKLNIDYEAKLKALEEEQEKKAEELEEYFNNSKWAYTNNPYLVKKGFEKNYYLKQDKLGNLLIPLKDVNNKFWNIQTIFKSGDKIFQKGAKKAGCFFILGAKSLYNIKDVIIVEGFATGASLHEAIQQPIIIAFDVGNVETVAKAINEKYPKKNIIISTDNDHFKDINIGLKVAKYLKEEYSFNYILPSFEENEQLSDWNDLHLEKGLNEVKKQFEQNLKKEDNEK